MAPDINAMANWATDGYANNQVPRKEEYEIPGEFNVSSCFALNQSTGHLQHPPVGPEIQDIRPPGGVHSLTSYE